MGRTPRKRRGPQRRAYTTPHLRVHGDLRAFTLAKNGSRTDGRGKPRTRASGART